MSVSSRFSIRFTFLALGAIAAAAQESINYASIGGRVTDASGAVVQRQQLMEKIYADDRFVSDRTIDGHIKKLRRKLEAADPKAKLIHSVYSVGYKFEAES